MNRINGGQPGLFPISPPEKASQYDLVGNTAQASVMERLFTVGACGFDEQGFFRKHATGLGL